MSYNAFEGINILYGDPHFNKIVNTHFMVIGIGGVGSWICEALARSGVKKITIIDLDDICVSNINRQVHATKETIGAFKTDSMKKRMLEINPEIEVNCIQEYFSDKTSEKILSSNCDFIFDAMDSINPKALLLDQCRKTSTPVITIGAAGGLKDPTKIQVTDLNRTTHDKMFYKLKRVLKKEYSFPRFPDKKFNIPAVYSTEELILRPQINQQNKSHETNCNNGLGSASFVTATFGFIALAKSFNDLYIENQ